MSLIATRLQNWRINSPEIDRNMARLSEYGAYDFFKSQTDAPNSILRPDLVRRAFESMGNTVQISAINYDSGVTINSARSCVIADSENTSALITVNFVTLAWGFTMVPAMYSNNEISMQHDWNRKMEKYIRAVGAKLDEYAIAALESAKTQVFGNSLYYSTAGNTVDVPWNMRTEILGDLNPMMRANDYPRPIHIIGESGTMSIIGKLAQHGLYNDQNKRLEYADKILHFTNQIDNEEGKFATLFAVEDGNVGMLTRVDREALRRTRAAGHEFDTAVLPYLNLEVGTHYYQEVGNQSAIAGDATADLVCAAKELYGFSVDVAFITAYNSAPSTVANPVIKVEIDSPADGEGIAQPVVVVNSATNPVNTKAATA